MEGVDVISYEDNATGIMIEKKVFLEFVQEL